MMTSPASRDVRMLDLAAEFAVFGDDVRRVVNDVLESQYFIGGPAIAEFEAAMCRRVGVAHAVAVSSGTDALLCALMTLGVGAGDEVILPSFTVFATAGVLARVGATPVFVDIDEQTFNLDPERVEAAMTAQTKAIIAVHVFGQCADMDAINELALRRGVKVIEDAAQAIDATYHGRKACALGDLACLSFYPTKNLGGFGEGGMVLTNDASLAVLARQMRVHGESSRYHHTHVGGNFRLDTMKAAILLVKLNHLNDFTARRRNHARQYDELLSGLGVTTPHVPAGHEPVYHQYTIMCDHRDALAAYLRERGAQSGVYYPVGLHLQECFASLGYKPGSLPVTERACGRVLSLPCHPMLSTEDVAFVAGQVQAFSVAGGSTSGSTDTSALSGRPA